MKPIKTITHEGFSFDGIATSLSSGLHPNGQSMVVNLTLIPIRVDENGNTILLPQELTDENGERLVTGFKTPDIAKCDNRNAKIAFMKIKAAVEEFAIAEGLAKADNAE